MDNLPDNRQYMVLLFDFYGALLTNRQRECFSLHYMDDLSMSEIGNEFDTTPQAAQDIIKRTAKKLEYYEDKLGLLGKHKSRHEILEAVRDMMSKFGEGENKQITAHVSVLAEKMADL